MLALLAVVSLAGCGESSAEKDARASRDDQKAIQRLSHSTNSAALAGVEYQRAQLVHMRAVRHLQLVERAISEGQPPPQTELPPAEERAYLQKDRRLVAIERWIRAGAHPPGPGEQP